MASSKDDIHTLAASKHSDEVVKKGLSNELDVAVTIIETSKDIPYVGSLIKLFQVGSSLFCFLNYYKKLARFLKRATEIPVESRKAFIESWNPTMREKAAEYITSVLIAAEDSEKAEVLGLLYKSRLLEQIDDEMLLRLTSIVNHIYIRDLRLIDVDPDADNDDVDNIISNFTACGIIADQTGVWHNDEMQRDANGSLACHFNSAGETLYEILKQAGWYNR